MTFLTYYWKQLDQTWKIYRREKKKATLISLMDVLVFFIFGYGGMYFLEQLHIHSQAMFQLLGGKIPTDPISATTLLDKTTTLAFQQHYASFAKSLFGALVFLFVLWVVSQGINWKKAWEAIDKKSRKTSWFSFFQNYVMLHVFWVGVWLIFSFVFINISLRNVFGSVALISDAQLLWLAVIVGAILGYFYVISLLLIHCYRGLSLIKMIFVKGWVNIKKIGILYCGVILDVVVGVWLLSLLAGISEGWYVFAVFFGVLLYIVYFSFMRMFFIRCWLGKK